MAYNNSRAEFFTDDELGRYYGRTRMQIEEELLALNSSLSEMADWEGDELRANIGGNKSNSNELYEAVKDDSGILVYLEEISAERNQRRVRTIERDGLPRIQRVVRGLLQRGLPYEVNDNNSRRRVLSSKSSSDGSDSECESLSLEDF